MTRSKMLTLAIDKLGKEFDSLDLTFHPMDTANPKDVTSYWPGSEDEDVLVCLFKGEQIHEPFHVRISFSSITHIGTAIRRSQKNTITSLPSMRMNVTSASPTADMP